MFRTLLAFGLYFWSGIVSAQHTTRTNIQTKPVTTGIQSCTNWLSLPTQPAAVEVGDLDIPGNQITVEAMINRTTAYAGGPLYAGDIVSKHKDPTDANYLLRPNEAEITTTNGYFKTPDICEIDLNKTYHVAMVYDGATLKFYRNGYLMSQVAATGNLFQNDWPTRIGYYYSELFNTNFIGYIDEVRIWNVARTQAQIQAFMTTSLPTPTTQPGLLAYYTFSDLLNKQGNVAWNGTLVGSAVLNQTNPTCAGFVADSCDLMVVCPVINPDFSFDQDVCNPTQVKFSANTIPTATYNWSMSDGFTDMADQSPVHNFAQTGIYQVTLQVSLPNGCNNSLTKSISVQLQPANIINTQDTTICFGSSKQLLTKPALEYCWSPTSYLDNPTSATPIASPPITTKYYFTAKTIGTNLIANGDFNAGNTGFTSGYNYDVTNVTEGEYFVGTSPNAWNANAPISCGDHTTGSGNMMIVNGDPIAGVNVWSQSINILPNTNYAFSAWIQSISPFNPAVLQFSINGVSLGNAINANSATCSWQQFYVVWNSGTNSTATISLVNNNTIVLGNDFALDDISFAPILIQRDSVTVNIEKPIVSASPDTAFICSGSPVQLNAMGAATYVWSPSGGLSDNTLVNPIATPTATTNYIVTGTSATGCMAKDTVAVIVHPLPQANLTGGDICRGQNAQLLFTSSAGTPPFNIKYGDGVNIFTNANITNNTAINIPYMLADTTTFTLIAITDANGCVDSANTAAIVNVIPLPQGGIAAFNAVCSSDSAAVSFVSVAGTPPFQLVISDGTNTTTYYGIMPGVPFKIAPMMTTTTISLVSVTDEDGNGCTRTTGFITPNALITVSASPVIAFDTVGNVCIDKASFFIDQAKETSGLAGFGIFSGDGIDGSGNFSAAQAGIGTHSITYTFAANNGCSAFKSQNITVVPDPVANAGTDLIDCMGVSVQLNASGGKNYLWTPPDGLSNPAISNPLVAASATTTYTVLVTDSNGCSATDSVTVVVSAVGKAIYVLPNAFTPNGDGKNDCFGLSHWGGINLLEFSIYNRWGQLVFATKNPSECWGGVYKGMMQDAGTYVYVVRATTPCGDINLKGTVILIR